MAATTQQNRDFNSDNGLEDLLDKAIDYINSRMDPDQVFDDEKLEKWADRNDYVKTDDPDYIHTDDFDKEARDRGWILPGDETN